MRERKREIEGEREDRGRECERGAAPGAAALRVRVAAHHHVSHGGSV